MPPQKLAGWQCRFGLGMFGRPWEFYGGLGQAHVGRHYLMFRTFCGTVFPASGLEKKERRKEGKKGRWNVPSLSEMVDE
jgi:hypothetical protein